MKQIIVIFTALIIAGCANQTHVDPPSTQIIPGVGTSETPRISPELSSLSQNDIQTLARDALSRFVVSYSYPDGRTFRLSRIYHVDLYTDSKDKPGLLDFYLKDGGPYNPGIQELFGNYDTLPASVRKVVRDEKERSLAGYPLGVKHIAWSKRQAKVQICLYWAQTISESFTFLYDVQEDGRLAFVRSQLMGCSSPDGYFIGNKSESTPRELTR